MKGYFDLFNCGSLCGSRTNFISMTITDKNQNEIEIKNLDTTLKQLEVFMKLLRSAPDIKQKVPENIAYWEELYQKLLDKV
jgi:hypothetical protein